MQFIKQLFCKHVFRFVRNIYGDEINWLGGKRSIWYCDKCKKEILRDSLMEAK